MIFESKGQVSLAGLAEKHVTVPLRMITYLVCEPRTASSACSTMDPES